MSDTRAVFVTASGTEVGKTLIACALAHQTHRKGTAVRVTKPVATGFDPDDVAGSDTALLLEAAGRPVTHETIATCTPWHFRTPIAPDMAAAREGRAIPFDAILAHCRHAVAANHVAVIEGIGGTMVPLGGFHTVRDLIAALGVPAVVVSGSYLGALSHTLTAVQSLTALHIEVAGVVVSESATSPVPLPETVASLTGFLEGIPVMVVPRLDPGPRPWERVPDLTALLDG